MLVRQRYQRRQRRANGRLPSTGYYELRRQLEATVWRAEFVDVLLFGCAVMGLCVSLSWFWVERDIGVG